ncbi:DUF1365 domain-containing protein [Sulfidibacter corallicola]|uniref:DUF1365 domain-containing protein n=1 Tax=Sulfidibacter corallicola TaxID=2818388 RepID=A0A8A4TE00_SULCO|nr:DUF1365 domain-containing protein [Sulfidibacter corallicola]QTD48166.1 DUF1365 domain-containing protein [Sulfidibacter corallicola]
MTTATTRNSGPGLELEHSRLYEGWVRHRRFVPVPHLFRYRMFLVYLDLDELDRLFDGRWWLSRHGRPAPVRFRRDDYLGPKTLSLKDAVRARVAAETGSAPKGPIRMLGHLRYWGYGFNPVVFYYCFDAAGTEVETIVAEITNTPWNERFSYILRADPRGCRAVDARMAKQFHVSPFWPMDMDYRWRFSRPDRHLTVHMQNFRAERLCFDATLSLAGRPLTHRALAGALARHPFMTAKVIGGIYVQALRLYLKRVPFYTHPRKGGAPKATHPDATEEVPHESLEHGA